MSARPGPDCSDFRAALIARAEGDVVDLALDGHLEGCEACRRELARTEQRVQLLRAVGGPGAPLELDGLVVAAMQAGARQQRATRAVQSLARAQTPEDLEVRLAGPKAPHVLERLVREDLVDPAKAVASRYARSLERLRAPHDLDRRLSELRPGTIQRHAPVAMVAAGVMLALGALVVAGILNGRRIPTAPVSPAGPVLIVERVESVGDLDPLVGDMLSGVTAGLRDAHRIAGGGVLMPRTRPVASALLLTALLSALAACDGGSPGGMQRSTGTMAVEETSTPSFLSLVPDAPERVPHSGLRRIEVHVDVDGVPTSLAYDERVVADGHGQYSIELAQVLQPTMTQPQLEIFEEMQRARQGFFFKYRDLRIRNLDLFLQNYTVDVLDGVQLVAGVECVEIDVSPRLPRGTQYRLAIDPRTGLVLRAVERDQNGQVVTSSEFLEFSDNPGHGHVAFFQERYPGIPLAGAPLPPGLVPVVPQILPEGYREVSSDLLEVAGDHYVRRVYGDGFENLFFLQRREPAPPSGQSAESATHRVRLAQLGAWRVAELVETRGSLFVLAKVSEAEVLELLRSTL